MSLQLNIDVGSKSLLDKNLQQTEQRRFEYIENSGKQSIIRDVYENGQTKKILTFALWSKSNQKVNTAWIKPRPAAFRYGMSIANCLNTFTEETTTTDSLSVRPDSYFYSFVGPSVPTVSWDTSWTVQSIDETASVSEPIFIPSIGSVPSPTLNYTIDHPTGPVGRVTQTYGLARYYTSGYVQFLGTVVNISLNGYGIDLTPSIISQAGGVDGVTEEEVIANGPPFIPGQGNSGIAQVPGSYTYNEEYVTVTIDYKYDLWWSNDAISTDARFSSHSNIVLPYMKGVCILIQLTRHSHKMVYKSLSGVMHDVSLDYVPYGFYLPTSVVNAATPVTIADYGTATAKAYLCSYNTVREIPIPAVLQGILDIMNPPITDTENPGAIASLPSDQAVGFLQGYGNTQTWTPSVFAALNEIDEFISPSQIKTFSESKYPITPDPRYGYFSYSETDFSLYYAEWHGDPAFVDYDQLDLLIPKSGATVRLSNSLIDNIPWTVVHSVWNWEDPAYCLSMLTALGFTQVDLTPVAP